MPTLRVGTPSATLCVASPPWIAQDAERPDGVAFVEALIATMDAGMSRKSSLRLRAVTRISASSSPDWFCSLLVATVSATWTLSSAANAVKLIAPRTVTMAARMASTPSVRAVRDCAVENLVL